jgi:RTX calcium-binding nonapeptide repeat (4 copies)
MLYYPQRLEGLTTAIFFSCILVFLFSILTSLHCPIVYAAVISCGPAGPSLDTCDGTERDDNMEGDSDGNSIYGLGGDDQLSGGLGNDGLHGGSGNDKLTGGPGDDILFGSPGEDSFYCGLGNDQIIHFNLSEGDTKSNDCESIWP